RLPRHFLAQGVGCRLIHPAFRAVQGQQDRPGGDEDVQQHQPGADADEAKHDGIGRAEPEVPPPANEVPHELAQPAYEIDQRIHGTLSSFPSPAWMRTKLISLPSPRHGPGSPSRCFGPTSGVASGVSATRMIGMSQYMKGSGIRAMFKMRFSKRFNSSLSRTR